MERTSTTILATASATTPLSLEARHRIRARSRRAEMSALASARAERAALRPARACARSTCPSARFARDSGSCPQGAGRPRGVLARPGRVSPRPRHLIDKTSSLPARRRASPRLRARRTVARVPGGHCLADADVYELGTDTYPARPVPRARHAPVPLPVTLRVRPGTLGGRPGTTPGTQTRLGPQRNSPRASPTRSWWSACPSPRTSRRGARWSAPPRAPSTTSSRTSCSPCATRGRRGPNPGRSRSDTEHDQLEGMLRSSSLLPAATKTDGGGDEKDDSLTYDARVLRRASRKTGTHALDDRASVARLWFVNHQARATHAAAVYAAEDRFAAERARLSRAPDDATAGSGARCGARESQPPARALRRCAGCVSRAPPNVSEKNVAHYCSKACQARHWGRHRDVCPAGLAGLGFRRRETACGEAPREPTRTDANRPLASA